MRGGGALLVALVVVSLAALSAPTEASAKELRFDETPTGWSVASGTASTVGSVKAKGVKHRLIQYAISGHAGFSIHRNNGTVRYDGAEIAGASVSLTITATHKKGAASAASLSVTVTNTAPATPPADFGLNQNTGIGGQIEPAGDNTPENAGDGGNTPESADQGGDGDTELTPEPKPAPKSTPTTSPDTQNNAQTTSFTATAVADAPGIDEHAIIEVTWTGPAACDEGYTHNGFRLTIGIDEDGLGQYEIVFWDGGIAATTRAKTVERLNLGSKRGERLAAGTEYRVIVETVCARMAGTRYTNVGDYQIVTIKAPTPCRPGYYEDKPCDQLDAEWLALPMCDADGYNGPACRTTDTPPTWVPSCGPLHGSGGAIEHANTVYAKGKIPGVDSGRGEKWGCILYKGNWKWAIGTGSGNYKKLGGGVSKIGTVPNNAVNAKVCEYLMAPEIHFGPKTPPRAPGNYWTKHPDQTQVGKSCD